MSISRSLATTARHSGQRLAFMSLVGLMLAALTLPVPAEAQAVPSRAFNQAESAMTVPELVDQVSPSVVTVYAQGETTGGAGTGFVFDDEGHIVTNWHVVFDAEIFVVRLTDGTYVEAELIGVDPRDDIAVVKIDADDSPPPLQIGDSDSIQLGEPVVAIGTPTGFLPNTVSSGIVSGLDRDLLGREDSYCQVYANLIQHDAAISQGNSGGPLFNMSGEVIGINTIGLPINDAGVPNQNLNFAVPGNLVTEMVGQIIETGTVSVPYLGLDTRTALPDPDSGFRPDDPFQLGAEVEDVLENGPADGSGLRPGDVIVGVDGQLFSVSRTISSLLVDYAPGDTVELTYYRGDEEGTAEITLGELPPSAFENCVLAEPTEEEAG